jgi:predicted PurR-regulated permease PerM
VTSDAAVVFLGIMALAMLVMAGVQVAIIVFALRVARRVDALANQVEREIKPLMANLAEVSQNAVRASSLAAAQLERLDRLFADLTQRVDETFTLLQTAIIGPVREGRAIVSAIRAAFTAFRELRAARARARMEDEDALFIG